MREVGGQKTTFVSHTENICISLGDAALFLVPVVGLDLRQTEKFDKAFSIWEKNVSTEFS